MHLIAFNFFLRAIMDVIILYRHAETRVASQLITRLDTLFSLPLSPSISNLSEAMRHSRHGVKVALEIEPPC